MNYATVIRGTFVRRCNRFVAEVEIDGRCEAVHVKNTGRLRELLEPGTPAFLEDSQNSSRKYRHSLIAVEKNGTLVNIDSQAPNKVVYEALKDGKLKEFGDVRTVKSEAAYGKSRIDLYFESDGPKGFIEVKGVTLAKGGTALFPDAPTERGTKHVLEMIEAAKEGYTAVIFFLAQRKDCRRFAPNAEMDAPFAEALKEAVHHGVRVIAYDAEVTETSLALGDPLPVEIG